MEISPVSTGGFEVIAHSINPNDAALIANTVVNSFLELRLKEKISKSERSLDYLASKLADARTKMETAKGAAELFALEKNVLSNQEFATQTRRLKEFRITIDKLSFCHLNTASISPVNIGKR